jgi:hypothetical protein
LVKIGRPLLRNLENRRPTLGSWQRIDTNFARNCNRQYGINEKVLGSLGVEVDEMRDYPFHQPERFGTGRRGEDDDTVVHLHTAGQLSEIISILSDDDPVFIIRAGKDDMIGIAEATSITWMD